MLNQFCTQNVLGYNYWMKINRLHAIIGFLLIITPLLGFTRGFKYGFSIVSGGIILYFAMLSIHAEITKKAKNRKHDSFVENKPKESIRQKAESTKVIEQSPEPEVSSALLETDRVNTNPALNE